MEIEVNKKRNRNCNKKTIYRGSNNNGNGNKDTALLRFKSNRNGAHTLQLLVEGTRSIGQVLLSTSAEDAVAVDSQICIENVTSPVVPCKCGRILLPLCRSCSPESSVDEG